MSSSSSSSSLSRAAWIIGALGLSFFAVGCAPQQACPAVTTAAAPRPHGPDRLVYRFDFALSSSDGTGAAPTTSSFTLNLGEGDKGEVHVGKNVALSAPPSTGTTSAPSTTSSQGGARQDVGLKVAAQFRTSNDDQPLLDVSLEMSAFEPPSTIRKVVAKSDTLAFAGKPVLVTSLEEDHKRYQLTVTATRVR